MQPHLVRVRARVRVLGLGFGFGFGLAVQPHLRVDGAEGPQHAEALEPLVDGPQLERSTRCRGERGVPKAVAWG